MARSLRAFAWQGSPLGNPDQWPERLRGATDLMLGTALPAFIWWGPELIQLYNDAAIAICRYRHPRALGQSARQHWSHFWNTLGAVAEEAVATGAPVLGEDLLLVDGERASSEDGAWYTVSASAIHDDRGRIGGVFLTLIDTTRRLRAETRVRATEIRVKKLFQQAPGIVLICNGPDHLIEFTNDAANRLIGGRELPGRSGRQVALDLNVAALCVHQTAPREWEDHEMTLLEETAERTWAAVERSRAEAALRLSEERFQRLAEKGQ